MEWIADPTAWAGFLTLVILELILGIDNLVFIAILAGKLPAKQRDAARRIGLFLALLMRIVLLFTISWMARLTDPLVDMFGRSFSGRDLILLGGGLFLLFKATMEIHSRLEGAGHHADNPKYKPRFWMVIAQIVVLDAVFSLDAVITAVGMTEHLTMMIAAVTVAIFIMILTSRPLTLFVNRHQTVVMLCLGFLLMVGFALVAEGFGVTIPKGYLYAAIGFSIMVEAINQFARVKMSRRVLSSKNLRLRTSDALLKILGAKPVEDISEAREANALLQEAGRSKVLSTSEMQLLQGVLNLSARPVHTIMTPRIEIEYVNIRKPHEELSADIAAMHRSHILVVDGELDNVLGILHKDDFIIDYLQNDNTRLTPKLLHEPLLVQKRTSVLTLLEIFKKQPINIAVVIDEFGGVEGVVTHLDVLEAITGEFPDIEDSGEVLIARQEDGSYLVDGMASIYDVRSELQIDYEPDGRFATIAGLVLHELGRFPQQGDSMEWCGWMVHVERMDGRRIDRIRLTKIEHDADGDTA